MVIFIAGVSGAGKTVAAARGGVLPVLPLDSYFRNAGPDLPTWLGRTDWDSPKSYDEDEALAAVLALVRGEEVEVPVYDHHLDARVGTEALRPTGCALVAEGIYAPEVFNVVVAADISAVLLHIDVAAGTAFFSRLRRDVREQRMSKIWAVVRSLRLALRHRRYRRTACSLGAELLPRTRVPRRIQELSMESCVTEHSCSALQE